MSRNFELMQGSAPNELPFVISPARPQMATAATRYGHHSHEAADGSREDWLKVLLAIRKHARLSLLFAGSVLLLVVLATVLMKPLYAPIARIEIAPPGMEAFSLESRGAPPNDSEYLETQARNLASDELAVAVIRELRLDQNPDLTEHSLPGRMISATLSAVRRVPQKVWGRPQRQETRTADVVQLTPKENAALLSFQRRLTVQRDSASRIISVRFASQDPRLSAEVTNTVVRLFIQRTYEQRHKAVMQSTEWLSRQLDDVRAKMEQSNRALADFQQVSGIASLDDNRNTFSEHVAELGRQKTQAQTERIQLEAFLRKSRAGQIDSLPQVQSNQVVQQLTNLLAQTKAEYSKALAFYGTNHAEAKKLKNQMDELNAQLALQRSAIVAQLETSYAASLSRESMIDREIRGTSTELSQMGQYAALKKDATATSDLYNSLYSRIKEAGISAVSKSSNLEIVDRARVLDTPTSPNALLNISVGFLVALVGGVMIALVREKMDTRIYRPEDMPQWEGLPAVSVVPELEDERTAVSGRLFHHLAPLNGEAARIIIDRPYSVQAQAMRAVQTTLMLSQRERPVQTLMVLSSLPGEGKTTMAVSLAVGLAQYGTVCLIDSDLQRPGVARALRVKAEAGVAEYLTDSAALESLLVQIPGVPQLVVCPAGNSRRNASELIASDKMAELLGELKQRYRFVIVDAPPILPFADGLRASQLVDGIVLVVRAGVATRQNLARSLDLLEKVHAAPVVELVLNAASMGRNEDYYNYYKHYESRS